MAPPTVAVLGTGSIGSRHLQVLKALGACPVAVPARAERRRELEAEGWETAADLAGAARAGARAAVIATETARHVEDSLCALELGMPVLCEKPLAVDGPQAEPLAQKRSKANLPVFVAYCLRFDRGLVRFGELLGEVGPLHGARVECRSYLPGWRPGRDHRRGYSADAKQGGVLRDLSHEVDYAVHFFGAPRWVRGTLLNTGRLGIASEEAAHALWEVPSGALVTLELDYLSRRTVRLVRASGQEGELGYDFVGRRLTRFAEDGSAREEVVEGDRADMYAAQMAEFLGVLQGKDARRLASLEDGVADLRVQDAWRESADEDRLVEVEP